jgi:hypothetical protein
VAIVGLVAGLLLPRMFTFTNKPDVLLNEWIGERRVDLDGLYEHLAGWHQKHYEANERVLAWLQRGFAAAALLLAPLVISLVVDLAGRK